MKINHNSYYENMDNNNLYYKQYKSNINNDSSIFSNSTTPVLSVEPKKCFINDHFSLEDIYNHFNCDQKNFCKLQENGKNQELFSRNHDLCLYSEEPKSLFSNFEKQNKQAENELINDKTSYNAQIDDNPKKKNVFVIKKVKSYVCLFIGCRKRFVEKGNLKTHLKMHSNVKTYKCDFDNCGKVFITSGHLKAHRFTHENDYQFKCPYENCNNTYYKKERLDIHLRTHNGFKPYLCLYPGCDKKFNEKGNLKTHVRIHTGEKPYLCNFPNCERGFKAASHLKDHSKTHNKI